MIQQQYDASDLDALQERLKYPFKDISLLERAVTHSSLSANQSKKASAKKVNDLERLEFLGDRVLGLFVAEALWRNYSDMSEGDLAPRLNALVRKETCAKAARALNLGDALRMTASEEQAGGRDKDAILGDACEALLGALYIDGGFEAARLAYDHFWTPNFDKLAARWKDAKTTLQEWSQNKNGAPPQYEILERKGPAHRPHFIIGVTVQNMKQAKGEGTSKRNAEMAAAQAFLLREKIWGPEDID